MKKPTLRVVGRPAGRNDEIEHILRQLLAAAERGEVVDIAVVYTSALSGRGDMVTYASATNAFNRFLGMLETLKFDMLMHNREHSSEPL